MTRPTQKKEELFSLKEFLRLLPDEIRITNDDRERPDFEVRRVEGFKIGLEIAQYHDNNSVVGVKTRRALEGDWNHLRIKINKLCASDLEVKSIHGHVSFEISCFPRKQEFDSFVDELLHCAKTNKEILPQRITEFLDYPLLQKNLKSLRLREVACAVSWDSNLRAGWLDINIVSLENMINQKVEDLEKYSVEQDFDEYWLLIVSGGAISQSIGPQVGERLGQMNKLDKVLKESKFARAYIFQYMTGAIYQWPDWITVREEKFIQSENDGGGC